MVALCKDLGEAQKQIENLVDEAEKYLKGAEKYLATLSKNAPGGRTIDEKKTLWERVVEKVDKKFEERIGQTEAVVNGWYDNVVNSEIAEVWFIYY